MSQKLAMDTGEVLTRGTVWMALSLFVAGQLARPWQSSSPLRLQVARALNTLGCITFIAHVACAFHFYIQRCGRIRTRTRKMVWVAPLRVVDRKLAPAGC
jgi:hypothetical protein